MMAIKTSKRRCIAEINVVQYVDVMLVLLVIFMVTAPLMTQGVQVDLPQASAKELPPKQDLPVVVSVNANGEMFLSIAANPKDVMEPSAIQAEVEAAITLAPERLVMVKGDRQASYEQVMQAMVLLQKAGVASIGLETNGIGT